MAKKLPIIIVVLFLLLIVLVFIARKWLIVASVNGRTINRLDLLNQLEKQSGKKTLDSMITNTLIMQEASKKNVSVTQKEIDTQLSTLESSFSSQGTTLDQALKTQSMTRETLMEQIKLQILLEKMVGNVSVSDKEVQDYIDKNKEQIPQGMNELTVKQQAGQQIKQQKTQQKMQDFVQQLRQKAKIQITL